MPGTGKTQLILKLAQHFFKEGKTILITSYTNQALANILDREINK
jgi:MoxR-like ATPase